MSLGRTRLSVLLIIGLLLPTLWVAPRGAAASGSIAADVAPNQLLISFAPDSDRRAREAAVARRGGRVLSWYDTIDAALIEITGSRPPAGASADDGTILAAEPNYRARAADLPDDYSANLWSLQNTGQTIAGQAGVAGADIGVDAVWDITQGNGTIVVGVVDSGVDYIHPDLADNIWSAPDGWAVGGCAAGTHGFSAWLGVTNCDPTDEYGHGTHVAGTIGARGNNNAGMTGVNWNVAIMPLRFLDKDGYGYVSDAIALFNYAIEAKQAGVNLRVLNNSWTTEGHVQAMLDIVKAAGDEGILVVAAAGNDGLNNDTVPVYPADYGAPPYDAPNVITVAATDNRDGLADFSNRGAATVHLGAPGVNIYSTRPGGTYGLMSGTSMAAPHVSGAAALLLDIPAIATLPVAELRNRLAYCGDGAAALAGRTIGGRRLNVARALAGADQCATPPIIWPTPAAIPYGTPLGPAQLAATNSAPGTFDYSPPLGTVLAVGAGQQLHVTFTPADPVTYHSVTKTVLITVNPRALTITADDQSRDYLAPNPALTARYDGFAPGEDQASLTGALDCATTAQAASVPGSYPITCAGQSATNYAISYVPGTLTIAKVAQAITFAALPDANVADSPRQLGASASSGLPVTFGVAAEGPCAIAGTTLTLLRAGTCTVIAQQAGDSFYAAASPVTRSFAIAAQLLPSPSPTRTYSLTIAIIGDGTVAASPAPGLLAAGTTVTLRAQPGAGQLFTGWVVNGVVRSYATDVQLVMSDHRAVVARFAPQPAFADVPTTTAAHAAIGQLAARGIIRGYDPQTFGPDDPTLRAQMAALIARAMGWDAEDHGNAFPDQGTVDADLWRNVGTLAFHDVARGYPDGTYDPTGEVLNAQVISFIARAMVAKGYWTQQPDDPALYPGVPLASGHRQDIATFVHYAGALPDQSGGATFGTWDRPATRAWFARALWSALLSQFTITLIP